MNTPEINSAAVEHRLRLRAKEYRDELCRLAADCIKQLREQHEREWRKQMGRLQ